MNAIKWELEDLSLRYIDPEGYYTLVNLVGMKRQEREAAIRGVIETLQTELKNAGIKAEVEGRPKHFYSIYNKMKNQHKTFDQIHDLIAIRVLVNTKQECYFVLGIVHTLWSLVPGALRTISPSPKANMYQSLHTTVVGKGGMIFEVQIRTYDMHQTAEYGIAAHWRYKEGRQADDLDQRLAWLRRILDWQDTTRDPGEFGELLKTDLFPDEVFVFTPKGRRDFAAARRHAARFRLPHPFANRQQVHRRQGERPHRAAQQPAGNRRFRGSDDLAQRQTLARLAANRENERGQGQNPRLVQAHLSRRKLRLGQGPAR